MKEMKNFLVSFLFISLLAACSSPSISTPVKTTLSNTPITPTLQLTQTFTPAPTKTATPIPFTPTPITFPNGRSYPLLAGFIPGNPTVEFMKEVDNWAGKKHSLVGLFYDFDGPGNPSQDFLVTLEKFWQGGYISFVKVKTFQSCEGTNCRGVTSKQIAEGVIDDKILAFANAYKTFINKGEGRKAFIAPLQEMNGYWVSYGGTPEDFKKAYDRIQNIFFVQAGIPRNMIWWTFAPNGWPDNKSDPNRFEFYYPGDDKVDVVSFAAYNYGFCLEPLWKSPESTYGIHIQRMRTMAPHKPVIISETAVSDFYETNKRDKNKKNEWLKSAYSYLSEQTGVYGVLYFDIEAIEHGKTCYLPVFNYQNPADRYEGYKLAVNQTSFQYLSPQALSTIPMNIP